MNVVTYEQELETQKDDNDVINHLINDSEIDMHKEASELARKLGLEEQAKFHDNLVKDLTNYETNISNFPKLNDYEINLFKRKLHTYYCSNLNKNHGNHRSLKSYSFDQVPINVLKIMEKYKDNFDEFMIATPEIRNTDPVLFGIKKVLDKTEWYLLAKWSESNFITIKSIKEEIINSLKKTKWYYKKLLYMWSFLSLLPIYFTKYLLNSSFTDPNEAFSLWASNAIIITVILVALISNYIDIKNNDTSINSHLNAVTTVD